MVCDSRSALATERLPLRPISNRFALPLPVPCSQTLLHALNLLRLSSPLRPFSSHLFSLSASPTLFFLFLFFVIFPPCSRPTRVMTSRARPRPRLQTRGLLAGRLVLLRPAVSLASPAVLNRVPSFRPPPRNPKTPWYVRRAYS